MLAKINLAMWGLLFQVIGINVSKRTVWQMTPEGMHKVEEDVYSYHGPVAMANYGGRPVLAASQLQAHAVGTGDTDVVWWPLFDSISYPSAGLGQFSFYSNPIGQGVSSTPGVGAGIVKSIYDTNLQIGNQLTSGNEFFMIGSESNLMPGVSNAALPLAVLPGRQNQASTSVGAFANDIWSVGQGGIKTLTVGTDRKYFQDGPLAVFPPSQRLAGFTAISGDSTSAGLGTEVTYATWSGELYTMIPVYIQANQNFTIVVSFAAIIPTPSGAVARLVDRMRGYLIRQAT